ncbi:hypothetical protein [Flavobacterium pedocola]
MLFVKAVLLFCFLTIFIQDYKERMVTIFLYPLMGLLLFLIHVNEISFSISGFSFLSNLIFITLLTSVCFLYAKYRLKKKLAEVLGLGDILFFIFISFSFASISFIITFIFALFFSLTLHLVLKNKSNHETVPLAGYMAFFFGVIYAVIFISGSKYLYTY